MLSWGCRWQTLLLSRITDLPQKVHGGHLGVMKTQSHCLLQSVSESLTVVTTYFISEVYSFNFIPSFREHLVNSSVYCASPGTQKYSGE